MNQLEFSIVIPCFNEEDAITECIGNISNTIPADYEYELIVIDDGSSDRSGVLLDELQRDFSKLRVVHHEKNRGYGAALKTGIHTAKNELVVITDADGTYPNDRIVELAGLCAHHDMVVGARTGDRVVHSKLRSIPKFFLRQWASWLARRKIPDLNSGLRVFKKSAVLPYFSILSDGFSFTTTITLAMLTNHKSVEYIPVDYYPRTGKSKIRPIRDTLNFISLIMRTGTYFAPARAFSPIFGVLFMLGTCSLAYDVLALENLTDKTILLYLFSLNIGMFTLLADMLDKRLS